MMATITTTSLTPGGWINLILSVSFVTALFVWCLVRVLRGDKDRRPPRK
ncbi:hypothetical protein OPIT5_10325 [Opitutaceae bacterium TAV5]|nr:hypothetical protein OPIT5_10325 [Opitutaceae bacterium TAV5]